VLRWNDLVSVRIRYERHCSNPLVGDRSRDAAADAL